MFERFHRGSSNADIVFVEQGSVQGLVGIDRDDFAFIDRTPDEVYSTGQHLSINSQMSKTHQHRA